MDPHRTQVLQHLESFKEAYSSKDYGACTDLLSRLNGILIEKTSQGRVKLSKTVAGIEEKEKTENKLEDPEDFSKIPPDMEYLRTNPFGDMTAVENGENIDENNENLEENNGNLDENNHDQEQLEENQEPVLRSQRIHTPTTRMLHRLEQQLDSEKKTKKSQ